MHKETWKNMCALLACISHRTVGAKKKKKSQPQLLETLQVEVNILTAPERKTKGSKFISALFSSAVNVQHLCQ